MGTRSSAKHAIGHSHNPESLTHSTSRVSLRSTDDAAATSYRLGSIRSASGKQWCRPRKRRNSTRSAAVARSQTRSVSHPAAPFFAFTQFCRLLAESDGGSGWSWMTSLPSFRSGASARLMCLQKKKARFYRVHHPPSPKRKFRIRQPLHASAWPRMECKKEGTVSPFLQGRAPLCAKIGAEICPAARWAGRWRRKINALLRPPSLRPPEGCRPCPQARSTCCRRVCGRVFSH